MKRNPRYGPQPGERVRVKSVFGGYPLRDGLKEGDVVLLTEWTGASYHAEFEGRTLAIDQVNIVKPTLLTDGRMFCPDCNKQLVRREALWICSNRTCAFRCRVDSPAAVME